MRNENCCEVYDSISRIFSVFKLFVPRKGYSFDYDSYTLFNVGNKMFIFYTLIIDNCKYNKLRMHVYNLDENELIIVFI